jgi:hypothetical protein
MASDSEGQAPRQRGDHPNLTMMPCDSALLYTPAEIDALDLLPALRSDLQTNTFPYSAQLESLGPQDMSPSTSIVGAVLLSKPISPPILRYHLDNPQPTKWRGMLVTPSHLAFRPTTAPSTP